MAKGLVKDGCLNSTLRPFIVLGGAIFEECCFLSGASRIRESPAYLEKKVRWSLAAEPPDQISTGPLQQWKAV
jgi:hypothetical protein